MPSCYRAVTTSAADRWRRIATVSLVNARLVASDLNLATAWEAIAHALPERPAVACGEVVRCWGAFENRAARLAAALVDHGVGRNEKVALALFNGCEYLEAEFAAFKVRAIPANVNYRYRLDEMRYVLDNADASVLFFDATLREVVDEVRKSVSSLKLLVEVGGDARCPWAAPYESLIANAASMPPIDRSGSDLWFLYTGGTTGMPKAVMWEHRGLLGGMQATFRPFGCDVPVNTDEVVTAARSIAERGIEVRQLAASPLMHGTAGMSTKATLTHGGMVITLAAHSFDADELFAVTERHRATMLTIVGDAFSRPMLAAIERAEAAGSPYDLSSVRSIISSGIMWSEEVKNEFLRRYPVALVDILGSSEGTGIARQVASRNKRAATARFVLSDESQVFSDDGRVVEPGSSATGRIAISFPMPLGYYKDEAKTDATFPTINGRRWSMPGDYARVEADGSVVLLGRGSQCINTGGEKVFPEEVEEMLKTHAEVIDAIVIGMPDERWGSAVTAIVARAPGATVSSEALALLVRERLAPYKAPKRVIFVEHVARLVNGKPDFAWAKDVAAAST